ncbi:MAG: cysteine synthase family protein [Cyanobacteria bacterium SZAS TMP-1]|nr:cysteine synthase family protein [Cyanobacteria bacterium SZAS TMP-1]
MQVLDSIAEAIGHTPMVKLSRFGKGLGHNLLAKCEFLNPGGSIKDRIAWHMVCKAEERGDLKPGGMIVEATAGNTGVGLAMAAALKGYKLTTVMSAKVSQDKVKLLKALGAQVIITPMGKAVDDPEHFINRARAIAAEQGAWLSDQFNNQDNIEAHYQLTGPEIWEQTEGTVDLLIAGAGTGGTLSGAGKYLKERKPSVRVVLTDPVGSVQSHIFNETKGNPAAYLVEGIGGEIIANNLHLDIIDAAISISDQEAISAAYDLMRTEALFVGSSSGCIAAAAVSYCRRLSLDGERDLNVVAVLPDGGRAYMSTIYDDSWLNEKNINLREKAIR